MMDIHQAIDFAVCYLSISFKEYDAPPDTKYKFKREVNYYLCQSINRILSVEGKITRRQVILLVEAWLLANPEQNPLEKAIKYD